MAKKKAPPNADDADRQAHEQAGKSRPPTRPDVVAALKTLMRPERWYTLRAYIHGRLMASIPGVAESQAWLTDKGAPGTLAFVHEALSRARLELTLLCEDADEAARQTIHPLADTYNKAVELTGAGRKTGGG